MGNMRNYFYYALYPLYSDRRYDQYIGRDVSNKQVEASRLFASLIKNLLYAKKESYSGEFLQGRFRVKAYFVVHRAGNLRGPKKW